MKTIKPLFKSLLITSTVVLTSIHVVLGQKNIGPVVDAIISKAMSDGQIPGAAVAVIQNGNVLYKNTYGVRSVNNKIPPDENSVFSIGSVSKAFTAIGVMKLVEQNKISLDGPINKYLDKLPADWGEITIRQFMTHTSGIPQLNGIKDGNSFDSTIIKAAALPLAFKPGTKQVYNNFNFAVMGKLIEKVSGLDYMTYMQQNVFGPAGMATTGVKPATDDVTTGHMPRKDKIVPITTHFETGDFGVPSGGLQTTLADFIKLSSALDKNLLITAVTKNIMWTPLPRHSNTPGWHSRKAGGELVVFKNGGGTGIGSECNYTIVPWRNLYVVIMLNKFKNAGSSATGLANAVLEQCFKIPSDSGADEGGGD